MPDLLLELFSEEIPARMQARAAEDLARLLTDALAALAPAEIRTFHGPRRIALAATLAASVPAAATLERGPRTSAPEQALAGFLRKHGAARDAVTEENGYYVLRRETAAQDAATLVAAALPGLLRRFPWPKSMRWGGTGSLFTWVRPLRRILCLLEGAVVPFTLAEGADDGHGLHATDLTEGHRFMAPGPFPVRSAEEWEAGLLARHVIADAATRRQKMAEGVAALAAAQGCTIVDDLALLDEVAGLVEWPVPLLGRIAPEFMDLPPEVMQVSMRVNQRYFALRDASGAAAPFFAFAANIDAPDGGAAIVAGNERVLRARFSDARHFWNADRRTQLADRVAALDAVTFHAKLGTMGARVHRLMQLAEQIAPNTEAGRAAWLCKADLTTGMVQEFPELQGVMGYYYAEEHEAGAVARAIRDHYRPRTAEDDPPLEPISRAVALADKLELITAMFSIQEKPTGSGDPHALRRAALGVVKICFTDVRRLHLRPMIEFINSRLDHPADVEDVLVFIRERLRSFLKTTHNISYDVIDAVFKSDGADDIRWLSERARDFQRFLKGTSEGATLLNAYRRVTSILRQTSDLNLTGTETIDESAFRLPQERALFEAIDVTATEIAGHIAVNDAWRTVESLTILRPPIDNFFDGVTVNDPNPVLRRNRVLLLHRVRATMDQVADFSRIEG